MKAGSLDSPQPALVLDVIGDAIRVLDATTHGVVALVPRAALVDALGINVAPPSLARRVFEEAAAFLEVVPPYHDITWRTPFAYGLAGLALAVTAPASLPWSLIAGGALLLLAAAAWRCRWRL